MGRYVVLWTEDRRNRLEARVASADDVITAMRMAREHGGIFLDAESAEDLIRELRRMI